jgi:hypothetical protein
MLVSCIAVRSSTCLGIIEGREGYADEDYSSCLGVLEVDAL